MGIETVDKMTDHQIAAKTRQYFAKSWRFSDKNYFMKTLNETDNLPQKTKPESSQSMDSSASLISIAQSDVDEVLHLFETALEGLS